MKWLSLSYFLLLIILSVVANAKILSYPAFACSSESSLPESVAALASPQEGVGEEAEPQGHHLEGEGGLRDQGVEEVVCQDPREVVWGWVLLVALGW